VRRAIPATLLVLALAGCGGSAATGNAAQAAHPKVHHTAVLHPANGCWTVARAPIAKVAADLGKQAKLEASADQGQPSSMRAVVLDALAHGWIAPGIYARDLGPFDQFTGMTCESGSNEDTRYPAEAQFDSDFNALLNDISALQNSSGDVSDYRAMKRDVAAVEADYSAGG
jgi:hypothetical protein